MAKRRRLTAAPLLAEPAPAGTRAEVAAEAAAPVPLRRPPIAQVAGEAAATSALQDMADRLNRARAEGRMIQALALDAIETDYLVRDRLGIEEEAQAALIASLRARGQQMPVEVVELEGGRYGLISGWRRIAALRQLLEETAEDRFATVQAILRRPADAPAAYLAMVEENEIRVGLSHYERARIVARAVEAGVFDSDTEALQTLFAAASRPRRSKIGSFLRIVRAFDAALTYPAAIPERLGLRLSAALTEDAGLADRIATDLRRNPPNTAEEELARLDRHAARPRPGRAEGAGEGAKAAPGKGGKAADTAVEAEALAITYEPERGRITLTGSGVDAALARRLRKWLADQPG